MGKDSNNLFAGYVRMQFKHIIRSLLVSIPSCVAGAILTFVVSIAIDWILGMFGVGFKLMSGEFIIFPTAIIGLIAAFLIVGWICGFATSGRKSFESDGMYTFGVSVSILTTPRQHNLKFPRYKGVAWQLALHFLVCAVVILAIFLPMYSDLVATADDEVLSLILLMGLPLLLATQIAYFFVGISAYKRARCSNCKRVFCIDEDSKTTASYDTHAYSERTSRENIGSIGDIPVYADVTRGKITTTHHSEADVTYYCFSCGKSGKYKMHYHTRR